jgi:hypothetical protein
MHGLAIRLALAVNRVLGRKGQVVGDRYHVRPLTTPRQMRTSMVYVLLNFRKHLRAPAGIDPRSSGPHFSGWRRAPGATIGPATIGPATIGPATIGPATIGPAATVAPTTWMATIGWQRAGGPLKLEERPSASPRPHPT